MADIINFPGETKLDVPAENVLEAALKVDLDKVIILGVTKEGRIYHASTTCDIPEMLFRTEMFKKKLLEVASE